MFITISVDWRGAMFALAVTAAFAVAEGVLSGRQLPIWLRSLEKPRGFAPMSVWVVVALLTYLTQAWIAYRLLIAPPTLIIVLTVAALWTTMTANVAYNVVLARTLDTWTAYVGILWCLVPILATQALLIFADPFAAAVHAVYVAWVAGYDLPIMRALWKLNRPDAAEVNERG